MSKRDDQGMAYSFRFLRLDESTTNALVKALDRYEPQFRLRFDKKGHGLSIPLSDDVDEKVLLESMRLHGIEPRDVDIFASLVAERDTDIIEAPEHVTRTLRATCCKLTFSFTYVG